MAFKEYDKRPTFLDMEIQRAVTHSRNQQVLSEIDAVIHWEPIEKIVQENRAGLGKLDSDISGKAAL